LLLLLLTFIYTVVISSPKSLVLFYLKYVILCYQKKLNNATARGDAALAVSDWSCFSHSVTLRARCTDLTKWLTIWSTVDPLQEALTGG